MKNKKIKELDFKQQRFCEEYIVDWNATQAAIRAGYSQQTARQQGSKLLTKVNIQDYISECKNKIEELAGVSKLRAINKLIQIAFTDITEAYNDNGTLKPISDFPKDLRACVEGIETLTIAEGGEIQKLKMPSARLAIQDLAKMLGWNDAEKIDHSVNINVEI